MEKELCVCVCVCVCLCVCVCVCERERERERNIQTNEREREWELIRITSCSLERTEWCVGELGAGGSPTDWSTDRERCAEWGGGEGGDLGTSEGLIQQPPPLPFILHLHLLDKPSRDQPCPALE